MVKKKVTKKAVRKKASSPKTVSAKSIVADKGLARNFLDLQKVMIIQSQKIDKLTSKISGLLDLFSVSAKALAKKEFGPGNSEEIAKLNDKLDDLISNPQRMTASVEPQAPEPMYSPSIDTSAPVPVPVVQMTQPQVQVQPPVQPTGNPMVSPVPEVQAVQGGPVQDSEQPATKEA